MVDWSKVDIHTEWVRVLGQILAECGESGQCVMQEFGRLLQHMGKQIEADAAAGFMDYRAARWTVRSVEVVARMIRTVVLHDID